MKRLISVVLSLLIVFCSMPVFASAKTDMELEFRDVSLENLPTMSGEVKIMVCLKGVIGSAEVIDLSLGSYTSRNNKTDYSRLL